MFDFLKGDHIASLDLEQVKDLAAAEQWLSVMQDMNLQVPGYRDGLAERLTVHYGPIFGDARTSTEGETDRTKEMVFAAQARWLHAMADDRWAGAWGGFDAHAMRFLGYLSMLEAKILGRDQSIFQRAIEMQEQYMDQMTSLMQKSSNN